MSNLLEITGDDIALLNDVELRTLVGLLCEADYRLARLPVKGITWGGHQNAKDGGLDVVVRSATTPPNSSFIPRKCTGIQVKKSDMPKSAILKEMRPKGVLQKSIQTLIEDGGAYIIVSSSGSTTDIALRNRADAMREAVVAESNHQNIHLEFMDRGLVATWVRLHPSLVLWVRNKIGRQLNGWYPYGNWANTPTGINEEYLLDDGMRIYDGARHKEDGMSAEEGLLKLRLALSMPGISIRLAGLSGVGKTRLAQAIFDERVGEQALNCSQAFYTDMSDSPDPNPKAFAEQLIAEKTRAILIVDNCPPDLHRRLTQTCCGGQSTVSLLTVEYDVRDDLPDETSVFRLEPASDELIVRLVRKRFAHISQIDAQSIATFAGGNARVAIALANTVEKGETLSGFRDEELFERLFQQRHCSNEALLISAEVCSLVYSFECADVGTKDSELAFLASLIDKSGSELFRDIKELYDRDLIQSRDVWRAVLPHAIANRLARRALETIPKDTLVHAFLNSGSERLVRSFTRRLNYLHDCDIAIKIVDEWLAEDGWIGKEIGNLSAFGIDVLNNIAPVSPEKILEAIERTANGDNGILFTSRENTHYDVFVRLLRHLAYDQEYFYRSVNILCRFALSEKPEEKYNSIREILKSLFYVYLSGTHASAETRAYTIEELLGTESQDSQELGLFLLDAALEAWHFSSSQEFGFGARSRNYGYEPRLREELDHWYETFINICTSLALSEESISAQARNLLSVKFRGLWTKGGMFEVLEDSARKIHSQRAWNDGWIAVRNIVKHDSNNADDNILERLHLLEKSLRPDDLLERARTFALSDQHHTFGLEDTFDNEEDSSSGWVLAEEATRKIGAQVAQDSGVFNILLPDIVSTSNNRLRSFGMGLADGCRSAQELWERLYTQLENTDPEERQIGVFLGFLTSCADKDPAFYQATLDSLISDSLLGEWFPEFQTTSTIDARGVERLNEALEVENAEIDTFKYLAWGGAHESINDDDLAGLLRRVVSKEGGVYVAIEILKMRFHRTNVESPSYSKSLITISRDVLSMSPFSEAYGRQSNLDYALAKIANICLKGKEGTGAANEICKNLAKGITENYVYSFNYNDLLSKLAGLQPAVFLDVFLGSDDIEEHRRRRIFSYDHERHNNPLNNITDKDLISWCDTEPDRRYSIIMSVIQTYSKSDDTGELQWKKVVYSIFEKATNLGAILEHLADTIMPTSWTGSRADVMQRRLVLFQSLHDHENDEIRAWSKSQFQALQEVIRRVRELENKENRKLNESFE